MHSELTADDVAEFRAEQSRPKELSLLGRNQTGFQYLSGTCTVEETASADKETNPKHQWLKNTP